jgi:hypothetical protein
MASGARRDFLEDHWSMHNFKKVVELGSSLTKKLKVASEGRERHTTQLSELSSAFEAQTIDRWRTDIENWHQEPDNNPDPYQIVAQGKQHG